VGLRAKKGLEADTRDTLVWPNGRDWGGDAAQRPMSDAGVTSCYPSCLSQLSAFFRARAIFRGGQRGELQRALGHLSPLLLLHNK
jgi:hypothetical protein